MHLGPGIRYYTTITACNTGDLCTSVTSDGVVIDNSPPTQGIILDGVDTSDIEYQSLRYFIFISNVQLSSCFRDSFYKMIIPLTEMEVYLCNTNHFHCRHDFINCYFAIEIT